MPIPNNAHWSSEQHIIQRSYTCGHSLCGRDVASNVGWVYKNVHNSSREEGWIYICPMCHRPTFFDGIDGTQLPGQNFGEHVDKLPADVSALFNEIRKATGIGAYTSAVLSCRKLLMHIAVEKGAKPGKSFIEYVDYLIDNHYGPPGSKPWVDKVRTTGNEANHEIKIMKIEQAEELVNFVEMLLKFIYEFPGKIGVP